MKVIFELCKPNALLKLKCFTCIDKNYEIKVKTQLYGPNYWKLEIHDCFVNFSWSSVGRVLVSQLCYC